MSVEDRATLFRADHLRAVPAAVRFLSSSHCSDLSTDWTWRHEQSGNRHGHFYCLYWFHYVLLSSTSLKGILLIG